MTTDPMKQAWAVGGTIFAAMTLLMTGIFQVLMGIAAIAQDEIFVTATDYTYMFDTTAWGWIHLAMGVLMVLTGVFLFSRSTLARAFGISFAVLSAVINFAFLPYYPLWSLVIIALDIFVVWSLATVSEPRPAQQIPPPAPAAAQPQQSQPMTAQRPQQDWSQLNQPGQAATQQPAARPSEMPPAGAQPTGSADGPV